MGLDIDQEKRVLLDFKEDNYKSYETKQLDALRKRSTCFGVSLKAFIIHTTLILINISLTAFLLFKIRVPQTPFWPGPSLTTEAVEWSTQYLDVGIGKEYKYSGPPSIELDAAWHKVFEFSNLRLTADEMEKLNRTSVSLTDGSGYYANLDVHHQLHCLKFLRWYVYPDYYEFRLNATNSRHADHCIENLRRNIMCLPSLELLTFAWEPSKKLPQPQFSYEHTCVNWDKIDSWAKSRSFDIFDESLLVNPILVKLAALILVMLNVDSELVKLGSEHIGE